MATSFRIDAVLNLTSNAPVELAALGQKFEAFDRIIKASTTNLETFEKVLRSIGTGRNLSTLVTNLERLGRIRVGNIGLSGLTSLGNIAALDARKFGQIAAGLGKIGTVNLSASLAGLTRMETALTAIERLQAAITTGARGMASAWGAAATAIQGAASALRGVPRNPPRGGGIGGGGSGGGGSSSSGGGHSSSGFMAGQHQMANDLTMGPGIVGSELRGAIEPAYKGGMDIGEERAKLGLQGFNAAQMDQSVEAAFETGQKRLGTSVLNNIKLIGDIDGVIHNADKAIQLMPNLADSMVILAKVGKGDQMSNAITAAKAGELGGFLNKPGTEEIDPNLWAEFIHGMTTSIITTHGQIGPQDFLTTLKGLGTAGVIMDPEVLLKTWPAIMQTMGASRAGTTVSSLDQSLYGRMPGVNIREMIKMGLVSDDPKMVRYTKPSGTGHILPGGLKDSDLQRKNLPLWVWTVLEPLISAYVDKTVPGAKTMSPRDHMIAVLIDLYRFVPRNPQTKVLEDIIRNKLVIQNEASAYDRIAGNDPNAQLKANDPKLHQQGTQAALAGAQGRFGLALNADAVIVLDQLTDGLNKLSNWARDNKEDAALYAKTAIGLAAVTTAMAGLGVAMMVISPAVLAITAAIGGGAVLGKMAADMFPKDHTKPGSMWPGAPSSKTQRDLFGDSYGPDSLSLVDPFGFSKRASPSGAANNNAPGSSPSNPIYNTQLNQPSGKDIANGVSDFQGRQIHGPSTGTTGFDQRSGPSYNIFGTP